jgi:hypothetical protein
VEKCVTCHYYDRRDGGEGKGPAWGQCRRTAPLLHPVNVKSYMIEGVWPHVRDDDWCGEWKVVPRRTDTRLAEAKPASLMTPAAGPARVATLSPLPAPVSAASD